MLGQGLSNHPQGRLSRVLFDSGAPLVKKPSVAPYCQQITSPNSLTSLRTFSWLLPSLPSLVACIALSFVVSPCPQFFLEMLHTLRFRSRSTASSTSATISRGVYSLRWPRGDVRSGAFRGNPTLCGLFGGPKDCDRGVISCPGSYLCPSALSVY